MLREVSSELARHKERRMARARQQTLDEDREEDEAAEALECVIDRAREAERLAVKALGEIGELIDLFDPNAGGPA